MNTFDDKRSTEPDYMRYFPQYVHCVYKLQKPFKPTELEKRVVQPNKTNTASTSHSASVQSASHSSSRQTKIGTQTRSQTRSVSAKSFTSSDRATSASSTRRTATHISRPAKSEKSNQQLRLSAQQAISHPTSSQRVSDPNPPANNDEREQKRTQVIKTIAPNTNATGLGNQISAVPSDFEHIFHYSEAGQ